MDVHLHADPVADRQRLRAGLQLLHQPRQRAREPLAVAVVQREAVALGFDHSRQARIRFRGAELRGAGGDQGGETERLQRLEVDVDHGSPLNLASFAQARTRPRAMAHGVS